MRQRKKIFQASATRALQLVESWAPDVPGTLRIQSVRVRMRQFGVFIAMEHDEIGSELGIGGAEVRVLMALRRAGAPYRMRPTDLVESLVAPSSSMARQLDQLASRGLIRRAASSGDGRVSEVALTRAGVSAADRALKETQASSPVSAALATLSPAELGKLEEILGKLLRMLANEPGTRASVHHQSE